MLYIYVAPTRSTFYDADAYEYLRTITLDGDMTTELFVFPAVGAVTTPSQQ